MNWEAIFNGALGAGALSIALKLIDIYFSRDSRITDSAKAIAEGGAEAVKAVRELLADYDKINDEQRAEIETLKARLKERDKVNAQRDTELADLHQKYEDLEAHHIQLTNQARETDLKIQKDTEETQRLRNDYAQAQRQIAKLEEMAIKMGEYVDKMKIAMQAANIDVPLNGEILDSVHRLRLSVEERRKLMGGK